MGWKREGLRLGKGGDFRVGREGGLWWVEGGGHGEKRGRILGGKRERAIVRKGEG